MKPIFVIGHKNPDTDSICSAICYARLKSRLTGQAYIPCRAGQINAETKYVLDCFGEKPPQYLDSLHPKLTDVQFRRVEGIRAQMSLRRAWQYMSEQNIHTIPVVSDGKRLQGLLTFSDIARFYMEDQDADALAQAKTSYRNIVDVLGGQLLVGDLEDSFASGRVVVGAANPDVMEEHIQENDLVILGNRYESQLCAVEMKASCLIIVLNAPVSNTIKKLAKEAGCSIVVTPLDSYSCAKIINQAVPVQHIMKSSGLITFQCDDLVEEVKKVVAKKRIRYYPILDSENQYVGMVSQRNLLDIDPQQVVLVDHNEKGQAVEGIECAQVTEIVDHHRIDALETTSPIFFRNQPLGCTATIVAQLYQENKVDIDRQTAGLLCSAIISDTLLFRSPTCTPVDQSMAEKLASCAGIDMKKHAMEMFRVASQLSGRSMDEIIHMDLKYYQGQEWKIAVSQVNSVVQEELDHIRAEMLAYMHRYLPTSGMDMIFVMLTNIIDESTELLFVGLDAAELVSEAFQCECSSTETIRLPGVVSRKKQLLSPMLKALENKS